MAEAEILRWALSVAMGVVVWLMKRTVDANDAKVREVEESVKKIQQEYLHKNDFRDFKMELRSMFEELKLDIRSLQKH